MHFSFNSQGKLLVVRLRQCCVGEMAEASSFTASDAVAKSAGGEGCIFHEVRQHTQLKRDEGNRKELKVSNP